MKFCLSAIIFLCSTFSLFAQVEEDKSDLDQKLAFCFGAGPTFPLAKYESDELSDPEAGLATTGINYFAYVNLKVDTKIGIFAQYNSISNPVNEDPFPPGLQVHDKWRLNTFMGGLSYNARGSKANVDIKLLAGYMRADTPSLTYLATINDEIVKVYQGSAEGEALCYGAGVNFRYRIAEHLGFFVNADYLISDPSFNFEIRSDNLLINLNGITQPIEIVNLSLGLALRY